MLPKRIFLFWPKQQPMSWMRYTTLLSLQKLNPTWDIVLILMVCIIKKTWESNDAMDTWHIGADCMPLVRKLNITIMEDHSPYETISAAQVSDILRYQFLWTRGGFYSDLDVLFIKPLDALWEEFKDCDAALNYSLPYFRIGFLIGKPLNPFFADLEQYAIQNYNPKRYQSAGAESIEGLAGDHINKLEALHKQYPNLNICNLPDRYFYPIYWKDPSELFTKNKSIKDYPETIGLHWFGGNAISQQWMKTLQPRTWFEQKCTFCNIVKEILNG